MEDLGQDEHDNHVQHQNQHAVNDPHGGGQQIGDGGGGGQQGDNSVQIDVGHLLHGGQLAQRSHGADQAQYSDKHGGAGALVEHIQTHVGQTSVHGGAHRLGDSGDQQGQTDQEDPVAGGSLAGLILLHLSVGGGGDGVQAGGIGLGGLVPLVGIADGQQQQGDPHGVAHGVQSQGAAVSAAVHGQGILHSGHVGGAADPGGVQSGHGGPGLLTAAQGAHKDRIEHQEAKAKGQGAAQEDGDHPAAQLGQLAEVAPQQHDENHGVQQVVLQGGVDRGAGVRGVQAHGAEDHVQHIDPHQGGDHIKDLPLGVLLQSQQTAGQEHQKCDVSKAVCDGKHSFVSSLFLVIGDLSPSTRPGGQWEAELPSFDTPLSP